MHPTSSFRVAVIQHPSVLADRAATIERAVELAREAAAEGAQLVVFPEAFIPGYPTWIWRLRPGSDMGLSSEAHARLVENSVDLSAGDLDPLRKVAAEHALVVVCGADEIDASHSRTTIFNTNVVIGSDGEIANVHRKLMPTNPERMVWGFGDGRGLKVVPTPSAGWGRSSAGRTSCRSLGCPCTDKGWSCTWPTRGTAATGGSGRCSTSPAKGAATS